jgi:hypothetical protein
MAQSDLNNLIVSIFYRSSMLQIHVGVMKKTEIFQNRPRA